MTVCSNNDRTCGHGEVYRHCTPGGTDEGPQIWAEKKKTDGMTAGILRGSKKGEAVQVGKERRKRQQLFRE